VNPENSSISIDWDLSDLYYFESIQHYHADLNLKKIQAKKLQSIYQNTLRNFAETPEKLNFILQEFEQFYKELEPLILFAVLLFNTNMIDPLTHRIYTLAQEFEMEISQMFSFFSFALIVPLIFQIFQAI